MLSYRHAFHAGNHADVLKHFILVQLLQYFNQKDKPYWVVDTHAGAGLYQLTEGHAAQNAEFESGIARLWDRKDLPPALADYVRIIKELNDPKGTRKDNTQLRLYPGSPWLAMHLTRADDRVRLFELHTTDVSLLAQTMSRRFPDQENRYSIGLGDGFLALKSVLPPPPRRGLVLMDPSYEDKRDYLRTIMTLKEGLVRFPTGTFAVWYPELQRGEARQLPEKLMKLPMKSVLHASINVAAPSPDGFGMHGSGMVIANPPWTLEATLRECLPIITEALAQDDSASFHLEYKEFPATPAKSGKPAPEQVQRSSEGRRKPRY
ncbi:MAG TPA: 23S rRNA (adenine(2030)-N(6))-methyltransferase RlmJ [Rhodocyclaceae bacterium]|nr:23S rRNA (adenine(2030)-N(6))-methyltransferase RlmJ [Rhodocyclaceae bacterium]